jgi:hypothetical protein
LVFVLAETIYRYLFRLMAADAGAENQILALTFRKILGSAPRREQDKADDP